MTCNGLDEGLNEKIKPYINEYQTWMTNLCYILCKNKCDAEDIYQETWVKVIGNFDRYDQSKEFKAWAGRICVNCFKDMCRRKKRNVEFSTEQEKTDFLESIPDISDAEKQDYSELYEALERLKPVERIAVSLFYFEDMSGQTAAAVMGKTYGGFRVLLSRALKKLRKELEK